MSGNLHYNYNRYVKLVLYECMNVLCMYVNYENELCNFLF